MGESRPPEELLRAAADGDPSAWTGLEERFGQRMWSVARACGLNEADTADAVQGAWLRLLEHLHSIRDPASVGAWLATAARREALQIIRRGTGRHPHLCLPEGGPFDPDPASAILEADEGRLLWQAVSDLDEPCRTLLRLMATVPDAGTHQMAVRLGVPVGSVGPTRLRCLHKLRTRISLEEKVP
ncbi:MULTISPECIES: RNA polymerase sigma factor [unclassified Nonomuraea]